MVEVHELLATNLAISMYKHGILDKNTNILRVERREEDRISQFVIDFLQDSCGWRSGRDTDLHPAKDRVHWYGMHAQRRNRIWARKWTDK